MREIKHKKIIFKTAMFCICFIILALSFTVTTYATDSYQLLQPLPAPSGAQGVSQVGLSGFSTYLLWFFRFALAAAAFLAVLKISIAGIMIVFSGASEKAYGTAMGYINDALWGLALAFTSYLILYTINPDLVQMKLDLPPAGGVGSQMTFQIKNTTGNAVVNGEKRIYAWIKKSNYIGCASFTADLVPDINSQCIKSIGNDLSDDYLCCFKVLNPAPITGNESKYQWMGPTACESGTFGSGYGEWTDISTLTCVQKIGPTPIGPNNSFPKQICCESKKLP